MLAPGYGYGIVAMAALGYGGPQSISVDWIARWRVTTCRRYYCRAARTAVQSLGCTITSPGATASPQSRCWWGFVPTAADCSWVECDRCPIQPQADDPHCPMTGNEACRRGTYAAHRRSCLLHSPKHRSTDAQSYRDIRRHVTDWQCYGDTFQVTLGFVIMTV